MRILFLTCALVFLSRTFALFFHLSSTLPKVSFSCAFRIKLSNCYSASFLALWQRQHIKMFQQLSRVFARNLAMSFALV